MWKSMEIFLPDSRERCVEFFDWCRVSLLNSTVQFPGFNFTFTRKSSGWAIREIPTFRSEARRNFYDLRWNYRFPNLAKLFLIHIRTVNAFAISIRFFPAILHSTDRSIFSPFWQTDLSERIYFKGGGRGRETAKRRDLTNLYGPTTANTPSSTSPSDYYSEIRKFRHPLAANSIYRPRRVGLKSVVNL